MERSVRLRLDGPQALYIGDCLKRQEQAAQLSAGKVTLAAYWQQLLDERLTREGLMLWVPLHIAPHGIALTAEVDLSGGDILDIALAFGDFGYTHMARLWAQLYASLAWDVAREILPRSSMLGKDYIDFATIEGRRLFTDGMENATTNTASKNDRPAACANLWFSKSAWRRKYGISKSRKTARGNSGKRRQHIGRIPAAG